MPIKGLRVKSLKMTEAVTRRKLLLLRYTIISTTIYIYRLTLQLPLLLQYNDDNDGFQFLPRDAMHKRGLCRPSCGVRSSVCPSGCMSRLCILSKLRYIVKNFSPSGSHIILVFHYQTFLEILRREPPNGGIECR